MTSTRRRIISPGLRAYAADQSIFKDERVLRTLLRKEPRYIPPCPNYFQLVQTEVKSHMRKEVADWMLEICEEQQSHPEVFCLAMNYFDRFLSLCTIGRSQLQLVGAVCLLVAWKVREIEPLPAIRLVEYSDFNITLLDIMEWEVLLLSKLDWDMSAVIASDFIEHMIHRIRKMYPSMDVDLVRRHSETLITMCTAHHSFYALSPSLLASAAVLTTIRPILESLESPLSPSTSPCSSSTSSSSPPLGLQPPELNTVLDSIEKVTQMDKACIKEVMDRIETLMRASLPASPTPSQDRSTTAICQSPTSQSSGYSPSLERRGRANNNNPGESESDQVTPTKVLDVAKNC